MLMFSLGLVVLKSSSMLFKAYQAFFFFVGTTYALPEDNWKAWLDDDGFIDDIINDQSKKHLFIELTQAKKDFNQFLDSSETMEEVVGSNAGARLINQYINAYVIRIKKIRLIIDFKIYFSTITNSSGIKYSVAKSCWISNVNGKVINKFTKNIGPEKEIKVNGKIPVKNIDQARKALELAMWEEYQKEYISNKTI
jgi:hypothetical protein